MIKTMQPKFRIIWIDDERDPNKYDRISRFVPREFLELSHGQYELLWIKSYNEWLDWVVNIWHDEDDDEYVNCFCLDHDLASFDKEGNEYTGKTVASNIANELIINGRKFPYYECHSSNPCGRDNIISYLESLRKFLESSRYE